MYQNLKSMPKVTLALITYNRLLYLKQALEAILQQTYRDFEVIIMDNGSTPQTYELIKPYLNEQVRYHRNPKNSRDYINQAFALAKGDFLLITHDDDRMMPNMLEKEVAVIEGNKNCMLVSCNTSIIDEHNTVVKAKSLNKENNITYKQFEYLKSFFLNDLIFFCPTVMLRKSFFIEHQLDFKLDAGPAHDNFLWFEANLYPVELVFISEPLYNYRIHSQQDGLANAYTMELILFPKTIELLLSRMPFTDAKPYLKLITEKSAFNSAFAYHLKKITKKEHQMNLFRYQMDFKKWGLNSKSNTCKFFLINYFNPLYILLNYINVRIKKL